MLNAMIRPSNKAPRTPARALPPVPKAMEWFEHVEGKIEAEPVPFGVGTDVADESDIDAGAEDNTDVTDDDRNDGTDVDGSTKELYGDNERLYRSRSA